MDEFLARYAARDRSGDVSEGRKNVGDEEFLPVPRWQCNVTVM